MKYPKPFSLVVNVDLSKPPEGRIELEAEEVSKRWAIQISDEIDTKCLEAMKKKAIEARV